ncbi:MAG TPA: c-type cytochrome [Bryobacteraceae bacterium]
MRRNMLLSVVLASIFFGGCDENGGGERIAQTTTGGNARRGASAIAHYGCGSCHQIPGISGANGRVAPPLSGIGSRLYLAGVLQNTPENMTRWIQNPKAVDEKTLMPDLGVTPRDAADIAGYLYTLK